MSTAQGTESMDKPKENEIFYGGCYHASLCNTVCPQVENVPFSTKFQLLEKSLPQEREQQQGAASLPRPLQGQYFPDRIQWLNTYLQLQAKSWCQAADLLGDLGSCSSIAGKLVCLYFERLVKYYTVPTRPEQTPFTVSVNPAAL